MDKEIDTNDALKNEKFEEKKLDYNQQRFICVFILVCVLVMFLLIVITISIIKFNTPQTGTIYQDIVKNSVSSILSLILGIGGGIWLKKS